MTVAGAARGAGLGVALLLASVTGCTGGSALEITAQPDEVLAAPQSPAPRGKVSVLRLDFGAAAPGSDTLVRNTGVTAVEVDVETWGGGELSVAGSAPDGSAVRLPRFSAADPGFAIVSVLDRDGTDDLSPGDRNFSFGADLAIDRRSTGTTADDGDNVIQHGLYEGASQYKLQVDDGRPSCRVDGLRGEVILLSRVRLTPGTWYRVRCRRQGETVELQVARLVDDRRLRWVTDSATGDIGAVDLPEATPLSIGGKLGDDGALIPSSTDQFNGKLDRAFVRVSRR